MRSRSGWTESRFGDAMTDCHVLSDDNQQSPVCLLTHLTPRTHSSLSYMHLAGPTLVGLKRLVRPPLQRIADAFTSGWSVGPEVPQTPLVYSHVCTDKFQRTIPRICRPCTAKIWSRDESWKSEAPHPVQLSNCNKGHSTTMPHGEAVP